MPIEDADYANVGLFTHLSFGYQLEKWLYGIAIIIGLFAFTYTVIKLCRTSRKDLVLAARLFSYKISLTVADSLVLFVYAPTQFVWITTFWWYGGDCLCRIFKFLSTFGFHLTANMQVLVSMDRLFITAKMNKISRNSRRKSYNTRLMLAFAWIFALICAFPQLYVFREGFSADGPDGHPQCIAIWVQARMAYIEQKEHLIYYDHFIKLLYSNSSEVLYPNGTLRIEKPKYPLLGVQELEDQNSRMLLLEQLYNGLHLSTICVIPYLLELFSYTCILYILKGARNGQFITLKDIFKNKLCCCFISSKSSTHDATSVDRLSSREAMHKIGVRSECETLLSHSSIRTHCNQQASIITFEDSSSGRSRETNMIENRSKSSKTEIDNRIGTGILSSKENEMRKKSSTHTLTAPWVNTVDNARRKARMKAFTMLSMNLLFWGPYCMLGIVNAAVVFEGFADFQFVAALVVFNAISNIML